MTPALEAALTDCDDLGIHIRVAGGDRLIFRDGPTGFPDTLKERLRAHRPELLALLRAHPRPDPDPVWFVSKALAVVVYPLALVKSTPAVWSGDKPFHRLTPRVYWWLCRAIDDRYPPPSCPAEVFAEVDQLGAYVRAHFRPDQIDRAARRQLDLPKLTPPPAG